MKGSEFKFLAMSMLLSGFSAGYIHAESHSEAVRMYVSSNPQLSSSASFLRLNVLSSLN